MDYTKKDNKIYIVKSMDEVKLKDADTTKRDCVIITLWDTKQGRWRKRKTWISSQSRILYRVQKSL